MGTVLRVEGFRFEIRSREANHKLPHVHVWRAGAQASFAIETGEVLVNGGFSMSEVAKVERFVMTYRDFLMAKWRRVHG